MDAKQGAVYDGDDPGIRAPCRERVAVRAARRAALAMDLLRQTREAVADGTPADRFLAQWMRRHRECGSRDRRWLGDTIFSCFRWRGWVDPAPAKVEHPPSAAACLLAVLLDAHGPTPELSALTEASRFNGALPAPLGKLDPTQKGKVLEHVTGVPHALRALWPAWASEALFIPDGVSPEAHRDRCIAAMQERAPAWLRLPEGTDRGQAMAGLRKAGVEAEGHPEICEAVAIKRPRPLSELSRAAGVDLVIQDLSSQAVGRVCAPESGRDWWDCCAGAGGKTLQLADLMGGRGYILASDPRPRALQTLRRRTGGRRLVHTRVLDARKISPSGKRFDGVLVDAPCSGLGNWARNPDARWRTEKEAVERSAALQRELLDRTAEAVRPGGVLVYAVCTLTTAETVAVTGSFLNRHPGFALDPYPHPLTGDPCDGYAWIWPWEGPCTGMFIARMRSIKSS